MANEIVKYHNRMNEVSFTNFTSIELNIFFSIFYRMREKKINSLKLAFDEVKRMINYKFTGSDRFYNDLKSVYNKLIQLNFSLENGKKGERIYTKFILFINYEINEKEQYIEISINPKFEFILNELTSQFTRFEFEEFAKLKSSYSKHMFKLLAQYNSTGFLNIQIADFREKLDIPISYRMCEINIRVLKPILSELQHYFKNLKLEKVKKGRNIDRLKFTFSPRKEKTLGYKNGEEIVADNRNFDDVVRENEIREEFEGLDINEQVRLIRKQLLKSNSI